MDNEKTIVQDVTFTLPLTEPLTDGTVIVFAGCWPEDVPRFTLNIGSGEECADNDGESANIAIQFDVRKSLDYAPRNSRHNFEWGPQEIGGAWLRPLTAGNPFKIEMFVDSSKTVWLINGMHYCNYMHRLPSIFEASWIQAKGIKNAKLSVLKPGTSFKNKNPVPAKQIATVNLPAKQIAKVNYHLLEPLMPGARIIFTGTLASNVSMFTLNIACGELKLNNIDIAIHFNVHMLHSYVVRNTRSRGQWGVGETSSEHSLFPFKSGHPFKIEAFVLEKKTLFSVDGELYCIYEHREPNPFDAKWIQARYIRDAKLVVQTNDWENQACGNESLSYKKDQQYAEKTDSDKVTKQNCAIM